MQFCEKMWKVFLQLAQMWHFDGSHMLRRLIDLIFQTYTRPWNFGIHHIRSLLHVCEKEREIKGLNFMVWVNLQTLCKCDPRSMSSWMALNDKGKINENLPTQRDVVLVLRVYPYSNSFNISIHSDGCTIPNWDKSHRQPLELRQVCVGTKLGPITKW
jgi:hypothetical protein